MGLVGAGPWAHMFTGPMLAASEDVDFVGIWSRRPEPAAELAQHHYPAAARLYVEAGFVETERLTATQWGVATTELRLELSLDQRATP